MMQLLPFISKPIRRYRQVFSVKNRRILIELIRTEFHTKDHDSILGVLWSLLEPLFLWLVLFMIFRERLGNHIPGYPLYLLIGIITVSFFTSATAYLTRTLVRKRNFVLHSLIPSDAYFLSELCIRGYKFFIELGLCMVLSMFYRMFNWTSLLLLPFLVMAFLGMVLGLSLIFSLIYSLVRDWDYVWTILSRLFLFVSPVFFSMESMSVLAQKIIYWGNPLTPFLLAFRSLLMTPKEGVTFDYVYSILIGMLTWLIAVNFFEEFEKKGVERI